MELCAAKKDNIEIHLAKASLDEPTLQNPSNCYLFVSGIEPLQAHLKNMGAKVTKLETMPWGHLECFLDDPYGNRLVLSQAPVTE